jgi:hypothetical protein
MTVLPGSYRYELSYNGLSFVFGRGTPVTVEKFETKEVAVTTADTDAPRTDGIQYGRDYKGGRSLTWTGNILTRGPGRQEEILGILDNLETLWDAEDLRLEPGVTAVLKMERGGRVRRVYGRPRRCAPDTGTTEQGWAPYVMDFLAMGHEFYDDGEKSATFGMVTADVGGIYGERIGPWDAGRAGIGRARVEIGGTRSAWLVIKIHGPQVGTLVNPEVEFVGGWKISLTGEIRYDQSVVIDGTPWGRSIRRNDGANWSGKLTTTSQRSNNLRLPPGEYDVILRGNDSSATARVEVFWRDGYGSH